MSSESSGMLAEEPTPGADSSAGAGSDSPSEAPEPGAPSRPAMALPAGTVLRDEYRVEEVLGAGSFGIPYRARDRHLT